MRAHFVIFYSPGTFVAERTMKPIDAWDTGVAVEMSYSIHERYGAVPYGFRFVTRERADDELDSHEVKRSGMYYLGGQVLTVEDIKARNDPRDEILISNMEANGLDRVIESCNSWKWTQPLLEGDTVLKDYELRQEEKKEGEGA